MEKVISYLKSKLNKFDTIIVACSGGPDSMCLLDLLVSLKDELRLNIICAHVNHKHRTESEEEEKCVKDYCDKKGIKFELLTITEYKNNKFTEEEARDKRYIFFNELVKRNKAQFLMTAHHGDDLIETILMRITRGSNLKGYMGFRKENVNKTYTLLRPLLDITKKEILEYCKINSLWYASDATNELMEHTRNRYRKTVTPFLKNEDENVHTKFIKFSDELNSYEEFINKYLKTIESNILVNNIINIEKVISEDNFIVRKFIEKYITKIQSDNKLYITDKHMESIIELINSNDSNKSIKLPNDYIAIKNYNEFEIKKEVGREAYSYILDKDLFINKVGAIKYIKDNEEVSNYIIRLDSSEIKLPLRVRTKENGDKIFIKNMNGSKKVKDIFIDEKVNLEKRVTYPIVADSDNKIIWIPGIKKSKFDKKLKEKYDIILKYEEEANEQ